jgi:hypothetical protein
MNKKIIIPIFIILFSFIPVVNAQSFEKTIYINASGSITSNLVDMPYIVNGSYGIDNLNSITCSPKLMIWGISNVSTANTSIQTLSFSSCTNFQILSNPYEDENSNRESSRTNIWSPFNYSIVYHMGEGSGSAIESSTNANNASFLVGITRNTTNGLFDRFITHPVSVGPDSYILVPDNQTIVKGTKFTATIWFRFYKTGEYQALYDKGNNVGDTQFYLRINPTNQLECFVDNVIVTSGVIPNNSWQFATCGFDGTSVFLWHNESFVGRTPLSTTKITTQPLKIAGDTTASGQGGYGGDVDEFRLTDQNLTDNQIRQMYAEGNARISSLALHTTTISPVQPIARNITILRILPIVFILGSLGGFLVSLGRKEMMGILLCLFLLILSIAMASYIYGVVGA